MRILLAQFAGGNTTDAGVQEIFTRGNKISNIRHGLSWIRCI